MWKYETYHACNSKIITLYALPVISFSSLFCFVRASKPAQNSCVLLLELGDTGDRSRDPIWRHRRRISEALIF